MSARVTAMKTAKTARRRTTISDWARSTIFEPTMLMPAMATTIRVVNRLSQPAAAFSPMNRDVA